MKIRLLITALALLCLPLLVAFQPPLQAAGEPNLSLEQLALLGTIATAAVWVLTVGWVGILKRPKPTTNVLKAIVFVGSVVLAFVWTPLTLPTFPIFGGDPAIYAMAILEWAGFLLAAAVAIMKLAQLAFDVLWAPLMGWLDAKVTVPIAAKAAGKSPAAYKMGFMGFLRPLRVY